MAYIYFMQHDIPGGLIKIGWAKDPETRLAYLQACSPVPLRLLFTMEGSQKLEAKLHRQFEASRRHGEWFEPSADLLNFIEAQCSRSEEHLLSLGEAAELLGVRTEDIVQLCKRGTLTPTYTSGGHRRFSRAHLLAQHGITFPS